MTNSRHDIGHEEQRLRRVIHYLYGEPTADEARRFEQELETDSALARVYEVEKRFDSAFPVGAQPHIDPERLQANRWIVRQSLQRETRPRLSLSGWLAGQRPLTVALQGAAMAVCFVLGVVVAPLTFVDNAVTGQGARSPLALIEEGDYEIYQLRVNEYDAVTGNIDLSFSLASDTRLTGNVADRPIHQLMAVALEDDIGSASRLDAINALQQVRSGDEVHEALIHVLMNDENPGVRYQAVTALADLAGQGSVREALRFALRQDSNEGVRIEAFNALLNYRDEQTLELFRDQLQNDSNEYIRTQSRSVIEGRMGSEDLVL